MSSGLFSSDRVEPVNMMESRAMAVEAISFHERLIAAGFVPTPICVLGSVEDGTHCAEIFEEEALAPGASPRFLVRLIVQGECEHLFMLADLPELLEHFDRLMPMLAHTGSPTVPGETR